MEETYLHYLWRYGYILPPITTLSGNEISIIHPGMPNTDSGPDFFNARIVIDGTEWAGNVEIHVRSSDWVLHGHTDDKAYDNVVLHVVYENDRNVYLKAGRELPVLELKNQIDEAHYNKYKMFTENKAWVPCSGMIPESLVHILRMFLANMAITRLERKSQTIIGQLDLNLNNWEETFYIQLARNFGFHVNADAFEMLARSLPLKILAKYKDHHEKVEALIFGQAGLLEKPFHELYPDMLRKEYLYLKNTYHLEPLPGHIWKFMRTRPANFPSVRMAQFAALIHRSTHLFSRLLECNNADEMAALFNIEPSAYWRNHYSFDHTSPDNSKKIGLKAIRLLLINTVVPFIFTWGKIRGLDEFTNRALNILESLPAEKNAIVTRWLYNRIKALNAMETQGLLELTKSMCFSKKCLQCPLGVKLLYG